MALYYTITFRGFVQNLPWAMHTHWRVSITSGTPNEGDLATGLAEWASDSWDDILNPIAANNVAMNHIKVEGYQTPEAIAEKTTAFVGLATGITCPQFVAMGFRQYRSNADFRASTHRFPSVREDNNSSGSWVYDATVTAPMITAVSTWFGTPSVGYNLPSAEIDVIPVLIRTQYTTGSDKNPPKVVTILDPHQVSDVRDAAFYGITSQASRKFIIGAS